MTPDELQVLEVLSHELALSAAESAELSSELQVEALLSLVYIRAKLRQASEQDAQRTGMPMTLVSPAIGAEQNRG